MSIVQPPTAAPAAGNHRVGLMIFGVFQMLLGCLCGLMAVTIIVVTMLRPMANAPQGEAMNLRMMIPGMVVYVLLAVALIWLGIGSICARRWAWTLTVVTSWMWLLMGIVSFLSVVFIAGPMMSETMRQQAQGKMGPEAILTMRIVMAVVTFCIYILLPALFLIFYHRASVWATCQQRDLQTRWTDRCPMPVLALSILMGVSVASMLSMPAYGFTMPMFGHFVSGPVGAAVTVLIGVLLAYLAWGTYRLKMAAWWGTLLLWIAGTINMAITFSGTGLMEMYEKMGMPATQLEVMRKSGFPEMMSRWGVWLGLIGGVFWLGYLLYVRRYFVAARDAGPDAGDSAGRNSNGAASSNSATALPL